MAHTSLSNPPYGRLEQKAYPPKPLVINDTRIESCVELPKIPAQNIYLLQ